MAREEEAGLDILVERSPIRTGATKPDRPTWKDRSRLDLFAFLYEPSNHEELGVSYCMCDFCPKALGERAPPPPPGVRGPACCGACATCTRCQRVAALVEIDRARRTRTATRDRSNT